MDRKEVQRKNKLNKLVKNSKKRISQMEVDAPGGFQPPDEEDTEKMIEQKLKIRIEQQEQLRECEVGSNYAWSEAEELERIYKNYDEPQYLTHEETLPSNQSLQAQSYKSNDKYVEKPKWYGIDMPKKILACEFNTKIQIWKRTMTKRNYLLAALKNVGFTKKELDALLIDGKVVSDNDKLKQLESDYEKKQLEKEDVDSV